MVAFRSPAIRDSRPYPSLPKLVPNQRLQDGKLILSLTSLFGIIDRPLLASLARLAQASRGPQMPAQACGCCSDSSGGVCAPLCRPWWSTIHDPSACRRFMANLNPSLLMKEVNAPCAPLSSSNTTYKPALTSNLEFNMSLQNANSG